jgi:alpha-mannosidase
MLHMIGNAHLDPVWLWRWPEGCAEAIGTCWAAADRLEETPGFVFTRGEAQVYAWIEEFAPDLFARIRRYVAEGRWVVVNGWWIQPDCNLPSGEAIIRQALYGKRYFAERFGIEVPVGYNVDSFGHAATFPMLLRHTGSTAYVFMRPGPHEMTLPANLFRWIAPDGSSVPTYRILVAYNTSPRNMPIDEKARHHLDLAARDGHPFMCFYGVGNHGGGPTKVNLATVERLKAEGLDLDFSDPGRYFAELAAAHAAPLPEVATELQFHAIGCYAADSRLKALNRRAEARLGEAETAATLALTVAGAAYPRQRLADLWRTLLFNQFHDTLGGTAIESACDDAVRDFDAVIAGADVVRNAALRHLVTTLRPPVDPTDASFVVANFNPDAVDGLCEVEPWTDFDAVSRRLLLDEDGAEVPFQYIAPEGKTRGLQRIAFRAAVAGYGYRTYRFAKRDGGVSAPGVSFGRPLPVGGEAGDIVLETAGWRLVVDGATGAIARLVNTASGLAVFTGPAHLGIAVDDPSDTWSHGLDRFGLAGETARLVAVNLLEEGALRRAIEIVTRVGDSGFSTIVVLPAAADLPVELRVRLDWHEKRRLFRIAYPLAGSTFEYEIAAGWLARPDDGKEVAGQRWVRAVRDGATVVLANDAKYSYAAADGVLYLTAARAPVFAHHVPVELQDGAVYRYLDQGEQGFTLRIACGADVGRADAARLADALLRPPLATPHVGRGGTAPHRGQWLDVGCDGGTVLALKAAEDGAGAILRAVDLSGAPTALRVGAARVAIAANGIASARLGAGGLRECDGLER